MRIFEKAHISGNRLFPVPELPKSKSIGQKVNQLENYKNRIFRFRKNNFSDISFISMKKRSLKKKEDKRCIQYY